jgi:hypothetical protein
VIEIYPPYKGTDTDKGFECMVIALLSSLQAVCIGEEGELYTTALTNIRVDMRYNRAQGAWELIGVESPE